MLTIIVLALTIALNVVVIFRIPKGFFPQQDTGAIVGGVQGPQDASFPFMNFSMQQLVASSRPIRRWLMSMPTPGAGSSNGGFIYIALKPLGKERNDVAQCDVINRLRPKMSRLPVASAFLQAAQDLRIGGRGGNAQYQYTIQTENIPDLAHWGPILMQNMRRLPGLAGREQRSAERRPAGDAHVRSRHRRAAGADRAVARSVALQRIRPVAGLGHLHAAQPVLRGDGSCAAILAGPFGAEQYLLCADLEYEQGGHQLRYAADRA